MYALDIFLDCSVAGLIRNEFDAKHKNDMSQRTVLLFALARQLKALADRYKLCVVVVNQVNECHSVSLEICNLL